MENKFLIVLVCAVLGAVSVHITIPELIGALVGALIGVVSLLIREFSAKGR